MMRNLTVVFGTISLLLCGICSGQSGLQPAQKVSNNLSVETVDAATKLNLPFDVIRYDAELKPDLLNRTLAGVVGITLKSRTNDLSEIELDSKELTIDGVSENDRELSHKTTEGKLSIRFARPAKAGEVRILTVRYHGTPKRGVRFFPDHVYAFYNTPTWLVCHFHPGDKAAFDLKITLPSDWSVVANGNLIEKNQLSGNQAQYVWRNEEPIPPYIFGFAAGRFREVVKRSSGTRLYYFSRPLYSETELNRIFGDTPDMINFFEKKAGVPYPAKRYTQVLATGSVAQEMSYFTVIDENVGKEILAEPRENNLVAHEFAHQWWGNRVSCVDWANFWLNESITEFMMAAYREHRFGRAEYERDREIARSSYARFRTQSQRPDRPLAYRHPVTESQAGGLVVYEKGFLVMHLLRQELGERAFWEGLRRYTQRHFGGVVATSDLQTAMEEAAGNDKSLAEFFSQWVYRTGVPDIRARHRVEGNEVVLEIEQNQTELYRIPILVAIKTARGDRVSRQIVLSGKRQEIRIPILGEGELLSVRLDDGGNLPFYISHEKPAEMLIFQLANEPDVSGRAGALRSLQNLNTNVDEQIRSRIRAALQERTGNDESRLIRKLAGEALSPKSE